MRLDKLLAQCLSGIALLFPFTDARADSGPFPIPDRITDFDRAPVEAVYHGVPIHWPTATFSLSFAENGSNLNGTAWLWVEKLGNGTLKVGGAEFPDRTWLENSELSELVPTWEWQRFPIEDPAAKERQLTVRASPWGDVYLGRAMFTRDPDALPPATASLDLTEETQLIQGRAFYPFADLSWGAAFIRFLTPNGENVETSIVDRQGYFSALVPREGDLFAILFDRLGNPVTEKTPIAFVEEGVIFQPLVGSENFLWLGDRNLGLTLRTKDFGRTPTVAERTCLLRLTGSGGDISQFQRIVERESKDRNPIVVDLLFEDTPLSNRTLDFVFADFLRRIPTVLLGVPVRRILTAEGNTVGKALTLASEHRDSIEGVIAWGGEPGEAVAANFGDCPVALLGEREDLLGMGEWIDTCNAIQSPLLVSSYWSEPDAQTLAADVAEGVGWVCLPTLDKIDSKVEHSTYLRACGRHQWVWITEISPPGALARVRAEWESTGIVNVAVENVDRVRIHLNCGLEKPGRQVTLSLETLTLPITLGPSFDALELRRRPDSLWAPRFIKFETPIEERPVARIPSAGFEKGAELKAFARFVRDRLSADCSWGYLLEEPIPGGPLSELVLCSATKPIPYAKVSWSFNEIESFHRWRAETGGLSLELAGYRPGVTESAAEAASQRLSCAIAHSELLRYFEAAPDSKTDFERIQETQRELIGSFLSKQFAP
jgi:hypothetical protein